jgi:hypothetical protein
MQEWGHWCAASRERWTEAPVGYVYLGEAVLRFGHMLFGDKWRDDDLVYAEAKAPPPPNPPRLGENDTSDFLERIRYANERIHYARKQAHFAAKQRADIVIAHVIDEARHGRLVLRTRAARGGSFSLPTPAEFWDKEKSRHVFKACYISPEQPFRAGPPSGWHNVYCTEPSLITRLAAIPGAKLREVSDADLKRVIIENQDLSQTQLVVVVKEHFADRPIPPSSNRIKELDRNLRKTGTLPKRKRGRPPES